MQQLAVRPLTLYQHLAIRLQIWDDCDKLRDGLVKLLAATPSEAKGRKLLLRELHRNEQLRRELFGIPCEEPKP